MKQLSREIPPRSVASPRRILIVKWSAIGDVVIATSAIEAVRRAYPDAVLHLNTLPNALPLFAHDPRFEEVFAIDVRQRRVRWRNTWEWLRRVRRGRYDLIVDLQASDHSRLLLILLALTGRTAPLRWGMRRGLPYNLHDFTASPRASAVQRQRAMLTAAGIAPSATRPVLHPSATQVDAIRTLLGAHGLEAGDFFVLVPGSQPSGWLKRWGAARYARLAERLLEATRQHVVILGGPDERRECAAIHSAIDARLRPRTHVFDTLDLLEAAELCRHASHAIGNDTGLMHVAAAGGIPLLVLCGPTDPRRVLPEGENVHAMQARMNCVGCYRKTCAIADGPVCMELIAPRTVARYVLQSAFDDARLMLARRGRSGPVEYLVTSTSRSAP